MYVCEREKAKEEVQVPKIGSETRPFSGSPSKGVSDGSYLERTKGIGQGSEATRPQVAGGPALPSILDGQVALFDRDWLPQGIFKELDELREEHHQLLDERCGHLISDLRQKYEDEDTARQGALAAGEEPPPMTGSAEREDAINEAKAQSRASMERLAAFIERAIAVIKEKGGERPEFANELGLVLSEWRQQFAASRSEVDAEVEAAKAALAKAERKATYVDQIEGWLNRTVKPRGGRYIEAPEFGSGLTEAEREEFRLGQHAAKLEVN